MRVINILEIVDITEIELAKLEDEALLRFLKLHDEMTHVLYPWLEGRSVPND